MGDAVSYVEINAYKVDTEVLGTCLQAMMDNRPILLVGPPGCGKVLLAKMLGKIRGGLVRAPHYTISQHGMFGNSTLNKEYPGEVDLAKGGILLLDDFPEFGRGVVERLGEEYRVEGFADEPSYLPVFTATSCPCGWLGHYSRKCMCNKDQEHRYTKRVNEYLDHFPTAFRCVLGSRSPDEGRVIANPFSHVL